MPNDNKRSCIAVILAAGEGVRMNSSLPKVLHKVAGLEMVNHVVEAATEVDLIAIVTGNQSEWVEENIGSTHAGVEFFRQSEQLGTAHAVLAAASALERGFDDVLVLFGDTPLLEGRTLNKLRQELADGADLAVLGFTTQNPHGYGRLILESDQLVAIREHNDASDEERQIEFCNGGIMAIDGKQCLDLLNAIANDNSKSEYYLTDIVAIASGRGLNVVALEGEEEEVLGINSKVELARAEQIWQGRKRRQLMLDGVTMIAPETVFLSHDTKIGRDTTLEPDQVFDTGVTLGERVKVHAYCHFEQCNIGDDCDIGPYARLRPGAEISKSAKVGNFVEIKNAQIGEAAKVNHLSYVGDAKVGAGANIGAGTITCNYDGVNKHLTQIGAGAFIGSNSSLVAPVSVGEGAYVGSGSVVTKNAPADALVVSRARQTTMEGRAKIMRQKALLFKEARKGKNPDTNN